MNGAAAPSTNGHGAVELATHRSTAGSLTDVTPRELVPRHQSNTKVDLLDEQEITKYAEIFESIDTDLNGVLSQEEVLTALAQFLPGEEGRKSLITLFNTADNDQNGQLEFDEFLVLMLCLDLRLQHENMRKKPDTSTKRKSLVGGADKFTAIFNYIDQDRSNGVNSAELQSLFSLLGISKTTKQCRWMIRSINLLRTMKKSEVIEHRREFDCLDTDGSGYLEADELIRSLKSKGYVVAGQDLEDVANCMIAEFDENGDRKIDFEEFVQIHYSLTHHQGDVVPVKEELDFESFRALLHKHDFPIDSQELQDTVEKKAYIKKSRPGSSVGFKDGPTATFAPALSGFPVDAAASQLVDDKTEGKDGPKRAPDLGQIGKNSQHSRSNRSASHFVSSRMSMMGLADEGQDNETVLHYQHCAAYLRDAFTGRLKNGMGSTFHRSRLVRYAFLLHANKWFRRTLRLSVFVLCMTMFWEPSSYQDEGVDDDRLFWCKVVEIICLYICLHDFVLRFCYMKANSILKKSSNKKLILIEILCLADAIYSLIKGGRTPRFTRVLRPWIFVFMDKNTVRLVHLNIRSCVKLMGLFVLLLLWLIMSALFANATCSKSAYAEGKDASFEWEPYGDFQHSVLSLYTLVSVESYVEIVQPFVEKSPWLASFFSIFVILAHYTLLNIAIAVQADEFQLLQASIVKDELKKRKKTLQKVFKMVTECNGLGDLRFEDLSRLLICYQPAFPKEKLEFYFKQVDSDGSGAIDKDEFLSLVDVLSVSKVMKGAEQGLQDSVKSRFAEMEERSFSNEQEGSLTKRYEEFMHSRFVQCCNASLLIANVVIMFTVAESSSEDWVELVRWIDYGIFALLTLSTVLVRIVVYGLDKNAMSVVDMFASGWEKYYEGGWDRARWYIMLISIALLGLSSTAAPIFEDMGFGSHHSWFNLQMIACAVRTYQLIEYSPGMRKFAAVALVVLPVLRDFLLLVVCFMYSFIIAAMEGMYFSKYFESVQSTVLTCIQLATQEGYHVVMFTVMDEDKPKGMNNTWYTILIALFFFVYTLVINVILLSQLMAVMLTVFNMSKEYLANAGKIKGFKKNSSSSSNNAISGRDWRHILAHATNDSHVKEKGKE